MTFITWNAVHDARNDKGVTGIFQCSKNGIFDSAKSYKIITTSKEKYQ